ncbi:MAG: CRISPR-associated protein Cas4 [candidate division WOR-3 bacterium]
MLSEDHGYWVTPTDVKDYFFCPQEPFLKHVMGLHEPATTSMELSNHMHANFDLRHLPRSIAPAKILRNIQMSREDLGFSGRLDVLVLTKYAEAVPCELKLGHPHLVKPPIWDRMQLASYAILVEKAFNKTVRRGVIFYMEQEKPHLVNINWGMKKQVEEAIKKLREMILTESRPDNRRADYCKGCWYARVCGSY